MLLRGVVISATENSVLMYSLTGRSPSPWNVAFSMTCLDIKPTNFLLLITGNRLILYRVRSSPASDNFLSAGMVFTGKVMRSLANFLGLTAS